MSVKLAGQQPTRFMYHSFPRRRFDGRDHRMGLAVLESIARYGLLLTPEIERWRDVKMGPGPAEDYFVVSRRCCFTELAPREVPAHAKYFGDFALEFDHRTLCNLGAMPAFYIPRMEAYEDYGAGPALVTQLAHVQETIERVSGFRKFAQLAAAANPKAQILAAYDAARNLLFGAEGTRTATSCRATAAKSGRT